VTLPGARGRPAAGLRSPGRAGPSAPRGGGPRSVMPPPAQRNTDPTAGGERPAPGGGGPAGGAT